MRIHDKNFRIYIEAEKINARIKHLGRQIEKDYPDSPPLLIGVLNGAFMFSSELARQIKKPAEFSFVKYSSYVETRSTGKVVQLIGFDDNIGGKDVIIVEDIVDTGLTMNRLVTELEKYKPRSIKIASLVLKPDALQVDLTIDYLGFEIEDKFIVGYGMDYSGLGRNLEDIYILDE